MVASGIPTPLVIHITKCTQPNFKSHSFNSMEDYPKNSFYLVPYGVLHIEDVRFYTHCPVEELRSSHMLNLYNIQFSDKSSVLKLEFQGLEDKGFTLC